MAGKVDKKKANGRGKTLDKKKSFTKIYHIVKSFTPHPSIEEQSFFNRRRNRDEMETSSHEQLQAPITFPAFTFEDGLTSLDDDLEMTAGNQDFDDINENYDLDDIPVNSVMNVTNDIDDVSTHDLSKPRATANIVTGTPIPYFKALRKMKDSPISESSNTNAHEESKSHHPQKTPTKKDRVSKEAQNLTSSVDEQQLNASPSESHATIMQPPSVARPTSTSESHATIIQPPSIERSPYVVTENSVSTSVHANQPRSLSASENLPPVTSSKNQQLSNFSPNAIFSSSISSSENQSTNMPFLEESSSSILKELHRLLCDPTRPLIIDDESLIDLKHVIIGDYNVHKEAAPHLSLYYPNNPITFLKCQKLHSYIKNGGTPLRFFLLEPSIDRVQTIFANGFSIFQHDILNKLALNPTVKIENDQCLGEVYQYITWWKGQMMNFGHVICSNYMISGIQQIPIRSFLSPVVCYPFSPTFKKIEFSFSKFNHRISCPFILSGTNIKVKSLFVIFVGQYGNLFPGSNIEVQPTRFNRNLNEIFSSLKVYDASKKKKFELKFYRNLENCLFLYEFPDKINVDTDFFVRFKVDFMDFGAIDDGYCLFAQIVNCLSVNN